MDANEEAVRAVLPYLRRSTDGWIRGACPFCPTLRGKSGGDSFGVNTATGGYNCFRCGTKGWVRLEDAPAAGPIKVEEPAEKPKMRLPEGFSPLWKGPALDSFVARPARTYLDGRGLGAEIIRSAQIGVVLNGYYGGRIVVPVLAGRDLVGWVARDYTGRAPRKYLYPKGMPRGSVLYRRSALRRDSPDPVLVVEGVFDALPHLPDVVAVLGKPSRWHVEELSKSRRPIVVALDGDSWEEAEALAMRLRLRGTKAGSIRLPPGTDPGDAKPGWLRNEAARVAADL